LHPTFPRVGNPWYFEASGAAVARKVTYDYNPRDQVTRVSALQEQTVLDYVEYGYYDDGSMRDVVLNGDTIAKYEYDRQRMRDKVTRYQADGSSTSSTTEYTYDYHNRLTAVESKDSGGSGISKEQQKGSELNFKV
jgi:hypothetical protein